MATHDGLRPLADRPVAIAVDVGGTTVRAGLVDEHSQVAGTPIDVASPTAGSYDEILLAFTTLAREVSAGSTPTCVGVAIPGPFDYEAGRSHMQHKFAGLAGRPFGDDLVRQLRLPVRFVNDADAFALGAWAAEFSDVSRFLGVTLGTGVGSGFLVDGSLVGAEENAPADDEIWYTPYRGGILEDWISKRGIEERYRVNGGDEDLGVRAIAAKARAGDRAAAQTLDGLGEALGDGLALAAGAFRPDVVAFGGKIALAYDVFGASISSAFAARAGFDSFFTQSHAAEPALRGAGRAAFSWC